MAQTLSLIHISVQEAEIGQGKDQGEEDHGGNAQDSGGRPGGDDHVVHRDFIELGLRHPFIAVSYTHLAPRRSPRNPHP